MEELRERVSNLGRNLEDFPLGAAAAIEPGVEDKVRSSVNQLTLKSARLLALKAQEMLRNEPRITEQLDTEAVLEDYAEEMAKSILHKSAVKSIVDAAVVRKMLEQPEDPAAIQLREMLREIASLHSVLKTIAKEQEDVSLQTVAKKQELQLQLEKYRVGLAEQAARQEERARQADQAQQQVIKKMKHKLEKLNVMRHLIVLLIGCSDIDYVRDQQWTKLLMEYSSLYKFEDLVNQSAATSED